MSFFGNRNERVIEFGEALCLEKLRWFALGSSRKDLPVAHSGGGGATRRAKLVPARIVTLSLTGSPTRRTFVASLSGSMLKVPMAPVNPGNSPSFGRGRTVSSRVLIRAS